MKVWLEGSEEVICPGGFHEEDFPQNKFFMQTQDTPTELFKTN